MANRNRRPTEWYTTDHPFTALGSGTGANFTMFNAISHGAQRILGSTITRNIIDVRLRASAVAQLVVVHWGIVVMNADARAAGAFPDPEDVSDRADWLVRGKLHTIQASLSDSSQWDRMSLDLRAQRRLHSEEDELQLIWFASGGFTAEFAAYIHTLIKLP